MQRGQIPCGKTNLLSSRLIIFLNERGSKKKDSKVCYRIRSVNDLLQRTPHSLAK